MDYGDPSIFVHDCDLTHYPLDQLERWLREAQPLLEGGCQQLRRYQKEIHANCILYRFQRDSIRLTKSIRPLQRGNLPGQREALYCAFDLETARIESGGQGDLVEIITRRSISVADLTRRGDMAQNRLVQRFAEPVVRDSVGDDGNAVYRWTASMTELARRAGLAGIVHISSKNPNGQTAVLFHEDSYRMRTIRRLDPN